MLSPTSVSENNIYFLGWNSDFLNYWIYIALLRNRDMLIKLADILNL